LSDSNVYTKQIDIKGKGERKTLPSIIKTDGIYSINANNNAIIQGSDIIAKQTTIRAKGDIQIESAQEKKYQYNQHEKTTFQLGGLTSSEIEFDDYRLSYTIADGKYAKQENRIDQTNQRTSTIETSDTLNLDSENITITGAEINTGGDITLTAKNDINIQSALETTKKINKEKQGSAGLSLGIKHQAADLYHASIALKKATGQLEQAKKSYDDYKKKQQQAKNDLQKKIITKEDYHDLKEDEKYYQSQIALATANAIATTQNMLQTVKASTQSTATWGFNIDLQLNIDALTEKSIEIATKYKPSRINTLCDLIINAGNAQITGSHINAGKQIEINAQNIDIHASRDTYEKKYGQKHTHLNTTYALHGGYGITASADKTDTKAKTATYNNSTLTASGIKTTSAQNTTLTGAVLKADDIEMTIGNDLKIASLQDTHKSKTFSLGASAGFSTGSNYQNHKVNPNKTAGINLSESDTDSKWVNSQTRIIGAGKVRIKVQNDTNLKGAAINSQTGDLILNTNTFQYSDLKDKDKTTSISAAFDIIAEKGKTISGQSIKPEKNFNISFGLTDNRQRNKATVGKGNIIIKDNTNQKIDDLNRITSNATVRTKNSGFSLRVDNDMLGVVLNPVKTVTDIYNDTKQTGNLFSTSGKIIKTGIEHKAGIGNTLNAVVLGFNAVNSASDIAREHGQLTYAINNAENQDIEQLYSAVNRLSNIMQQNNLTDDTSRISLVHSNGLEHKPIKTYITGVEQYIDIKTLPAAYDQKNNDTYLNIYNTDITKGGDITAAIQAETIRQYYAWQAKQNGNNPIKTFQAMTWEEKVEHITSDAAKNTWNTFTGETKNSNYQIRQNWNTKYANSDIIKAGNAQLNSANPDNIQPFPDAVIDAGFIIYDGYKIFKDNIIGEENNLKENIGALGADIVGLGVPGGTGFGLAVRGGSKAKNVVKGAGNVDDVVDVVEGITKKYGDNGLKKLSGPKLPEYHAKNFTDGKYINRQVSGDEIFYKYHGTNNRTGKTYNYMTNKLYSNESKLRNGLSILDEWGISIDRVTTFKPAKGIWISEGTAARRVGDITKEVRNGGGYQGVIDIKNLPKSSVIKTDILPKSFFK